MTVSTPLLDRVCVPADLKMLTPDDLPRLSEELRAEIIDAASVTGGHFGAGLGVIELTVALHYVFNAPADKIVWDVSHQAYPHKVLTGRRDRIRTIRKKDGLYGFTKRGESEYDCFGAAHSSTSVSAATGFAVARDQLGLDNEVIAVIGDGAASAGLAYEGLNNAGALQRKMLVVLNDNDMSIAPAVGALSNYLKALKQTMPRQPIEALADRLAQACPDVTDAGKARAANQLVGGTLFDHLDFTYLGPVDGHDVTGLVRILSAIRDADKSGPVLLHIVTEKGRGHPFGHACPENHHAVKTFDTATFEQTKGTPKAPSYTKVFAQALIAEAQRDERIVALTAAMPSGTGINAFAARFPDRSFDTGIAEQHSVTFAAALAAEGLKPFAAIYSTFLQRAYDQVAHDVSLQNLPVRFAIDRAGPVGQDGATHAGSFDITYLGCLPNMTLMAAADEAELVHMVATAAAYDAGPIALRYPRGEGIGVALPEQGQVLPIGRGRVLREGNDAAILCYGARLSEALQAAAELEQRGLSVTVADARFAKPLDTDLIDQLARHHGTVITIEDGAIGGFAAQVMTWLAQAGHLDKGLRVRPMTLPDIYLPHGKPEEQYQLAGLTAQHIVAAVQAAVGKAGVRLHAVEARA
ncbi:MAG: 1-deoxy-D-xylulose-5-phosphate synthase [Rhodothalassiaceae bacterium]